MPTKAKTFRVALSGATIDGREIKPEWLTQAAANYDPSVYAARVNVEHMRGVTVDGPFGAFGDITALRAETNKAGRVELYADIVPNDRAIAANKAGQKVYPSIEIIENFAGTGEAYVVGLALTDTPASTGTERLTFSAKQLADDAALKMLVNDAAFKQLLLDADFMRLVQDAEFVSFMQDANLKLLMSDTNLKQLADDASFAELLGRKAGGGQVDY